MNQYWRTFSRPQDNGHEYVAEKRDRPGYLFQRDGVVFVFNLEQVRAIEGGMSPDEAVMLLGHTPMVTTPPVPPVHSGTTAEPPKRGRRKKANGSGNDNGS